MRFNSAQIIISNNDKSRIFERLLVYIKKIIFGGWNICSYKVLFVLLCVCFNPPMFHTGLALDTIFIILVFIYFPVFLRLIIDLPTLFTALIIEIGIAIHFAQGGSIFRLTKRTKIVSNQLSAYKGNKINSILLALAATYSIRGHLSSVAIHR